MKLKIFKIAAAILATGLVPALSAHAQTVTGTVSVPANYASVNVTLAGTGGFTGDVGATNIKFTQAPAGNQPLLPNIFETFCIELTQFTQTPVTYNIAPIASLVAGSPAVGGKIGWLYNTYGSGAFYDSTKAAALQLAIWEVRYDGTGTLNLAAGDFKYNATSGAILTQAQAYLNSIGTNTSQATWLKSETAQDLVGPNRVPEPGVLALLAAGLPFLAIRRRK